MNKLAEIWEKSQPWREPRLAKVYTWPEFPDMAVVYTLEKWEEYISIQMGYPRWSSATSAFRLDTHSPAACTDFQKSLPIALQQLETIRCLIRRLQHVEEALVDLVEDT
jgi:hypothetical protein